MPGKFHPPMPAAPAPYPAQGSPQASAIREHLAHVIASPAFKGSRRSQEFLSHIVETALHGNMDRLKERVLGVDLFGRLASYDTGEDAIVRVTASDVRKRLHQFYSEAGFESEIRIEIPPGSYAPEFRGLRRQFVATEIPQSDQTALAPQPPSVVVTPVAPQRSPAWALYLGVAVVLLAVAGWRWREWDAERSLSPARIQPWAAMLQADHALRIIYCDPEILFLQNLLKYRISLADYANRRYIPERPANELDNQRFLDVMRGSSVASIDVGITINIDRLATGINRRVETRTARSVQAGDFNTGDSFIVLGSPRSNPWSALFADKLDFKFVFDEAGKEFLENANIQAGERARYFPTPADWANGEAFGTLAYIANPGQSGRILLIAGSNREATEATGKFATDMKLLASTLQKYGIDPYGPPVSFQILFRVGTMAGAPRASEVITCHLLRKS